MTIIIGGGISGLALAWFMQRAGKEYILLEADSIPGGNIKTKKTHNSILELGPNSILSDEKTMSFLKSLDLEKEIIVANEINKSRYLFKNGTYRKLPDSPPALLTSNYFSTSAKISVVKELFKKPSSKNDETVEEFFKRRFNQEIVDFAVQPFIAGIYSGDADKLLISETFPMLYEYEKTYGSILKGLIKNKATRKVSLTFKEGMQALPLKLASSLKNLKLNTKVTSIEKEGTSYRVKYENNGNQQELTSDKVILSAPAHIIADLLSFHSSLKEALLSISYQPVTIVHSLYKKKDINFNLDGFGALHPKIEGLYTSGVIWNSSAFAGRCEEDKVLLTSFVRKYHTPEEEKNVKDSVHKELSSNLGISALPEFQNFISWSKGIPQYDKNYKKTKAIFHSAQKEDLYICANWYNGVSISDCITKARQLEEIL